MINRLDDPDDFTTITRLVDTFKQRLAKLRETRGEGVTTTELKMETMNSILNDEWERLKARK